MIVATSSQPNIRTGALGSRLNVGSINVYHSTNRLSGQKSVTTLTVEEAEDLKRPMYKKDIFYSGSVLNLPEYKDTSNTQDYVTSIISLPAMNNKATTNICSCLPRQITDTLSEMLDLSLLKMPAFNLIAFLSWLIMIAYLIPFAFTSVRAVQMGVESGKASFLISILGVSTMLGRLLSCVIAQIPNLRALLIHNIFLFLAGISCVVMPFCKTYIAMAVSAFGYGFFIGGHVALSPLVLVDLIGLDKLTTAYGITVLLRGVSTIIGPPIAEMTNSMSNGGTESELVPLSQIDESEKRKTDKPTESTINADINEFIVTPPDGGWGWVIVLASFMNHFILDGICYAFGSFMLEYANYFGSSAATTSALMSTLVGCYMLSAPVGSALINKFGCRPVGIAGSIVAAISFVVCTFSNSILTMIVLFGVFGGIGFGLMYMPAVISVSLYFEKKRPLAVGLGMCGTGVGTFVFGPTGKFLLDNMDWKGAHYIIAGIILNGAVFAALIRPQQTEHERKVKLEKRLAKKNKQLIVKSTDKANGHSNGAAKLSDLKTSEF
ncbi:hypothetical protein EB796_009177 [Bugula neritina]|uniref:Major facilitator superfamily (MFS) profile domain-containing protein n=1 Tax=Bugula neritina TaxID=10212 RepID=A0A7J7K4R9_BUGNE|nr:hypothetical protein EB796_009177 [Bugula neritina]